jgi:AcrR family transcriptional regulator
MGTRETILDATIDVFGEKGLKFTMDDIANRVSMSKKTIYAVFQDKETLFYEMVDYGFDNIKQSERKVLENEKLDTLGKIRAILCVLPEGYKEIDFRQLYQLKDKYPKIYQKMEERLENGWENSISLLEKGMEEGVIRKMSIPIFKTMFEATLEQFFQRDVLIHNKISYKKALEEVVNILVDGIHVPK